MKKKILAGILVLALVIGLLPNNMHQVEAAEYIDATLTVGTVTYQDGGNHRYLIYLDVADFDETTLDKNAIWPNNTVYIDGKPVASSNTEADVNYGIADNLLLLTLDYSLFGESSAAEVGKHTVIIPKGTIIGGTLKTTNDVGVIIDGTSIVAAEVVSFALAGAIAQEEGSQASNPRYLFTFTVEGTVPNSWMNNTVYIDGNPVTSHSDGSVQSIHHTPSTVDNKQLWFILDYDYVEEGVTKAADMQQKHTLTIPSGTVIGSCILKNTLCYTLDKATITEEVPAVDVTVTPTNPHNAGKTGFQFTTGSTSDRLPSDGNWTMNYYFASGGVTYKVANATEEQTLDQVYLKKLAKDTYFLAFDAYVDSITFASGDIVTLEAEVQSLGYRVEYARTSFKYDGSTWAVYEEANKLTFTETATGGGWQTDNQRWLTFLTSTQEVPEEFTAIQSGLSIVVDDGTTETWYPLNADDLIVVEGKWALLLWTARYPAVPTPEQTKGKCYTVTLKAGTGVDNHGDNWVIPQDVPILYSNEVAQGVIEATNAKLLTVMTEDPNIKNGVYFGIPSNEGLAFSGEWNVRPYIECGTITVDKNTLTTGNLSLIKIAETTYYFSLLPGDTTTGVPETLDIGSRITFDFYASDTQDCGKVYYFPKSVFVLTDAGWEREIVLGDANDDQNINVKDIVRLKKYLKDDTTVVFADGADANESGKVDKRDIATMYEFLFEGVRFTKDGENSQAVTGIPYYADDIDISLGAYHGPRAAGYMNYSYESLTGGVGSGITDDNSYLNETEFKRYADAGLNTLIHEADAIYASSAAHIGAGVNNPDFQTYMELAYKQGLDVYVTSQGLNSYLKPEGYGSTPVRADFNENGVADSATIDETKWGWDYNESGTLDTEATLSELFYYTDAITDGKGKTILEADIEELLNFVVEKGYDNFKGFVMADEVYDGMSENYAKAVELIKAEGKERGLTLSIIGSQYPSSATGNKNSSEKYYIPSNGYESYVQKFGTAAGDFIFDRYPLLKNIAYDKTITYSLDANWLTNLATVAEQGKEGGFSTGVTLQSYGGEWWSTTNQWYGPNLKRDPKSDADIQFQVYTALAYGMKKINYFTYWEHPLQTEEYYTSCMVEYGENGGVETEVYRYVQNANQEIRKFDHVFLDYDWQETLDASDSKDTKGCVSSWSQTEDVILSRTYDKRKQLDGFWIVNASDPFNETEKTVNVTFADATKAVVFADGEKKIISLTNGKYETTLDAGEGQFVIPIK